MIRWTCSLWCAGVVVLLAQVGTARADHQSRVRENGHRLAGPIEHWLFLLPPGAEEELSVSNEQFDRINKLQFEFRSKRRDMLLETANQFAAAMKNQKDNKNEQCNLALTAFTTFVKVSGLHDDYLQKINEVLNADQRKQLVELQREQFEMRTARREGLMHRISAFREGDREGRREHRGEHHFGARFEERRMHLTDEQKAKLAEMRKELEAKFIGILTPEQKKQIHEFREERKANVGKVGQPGSEKKDKEKEKPKPEEEDQE